MTLLIFALSFLPCERGETQPAMWAIAAAFSVYPLSHFIAGKLTDWL